MKISIPFLDKYISHCNTKGTAPVFETFKQFPEELTAGIDPLLFEAYRDYVSGSRVISIFEFNAIKSYSEFLEGAEAAKEANTVDTVDTEVKKAKHGPEDNAKIKEEPATDDDFGIEIDIEEVGSEIDKAFKDIEDEILKLGQPEEHDDAEGEVLVGEDELNEATEENNIIIDYLFRRPKLIKIVNKSTDLKLKAVQAETNAQQIIDQKNEQLDKKLAQLKSKGADSDQLKKLKEAGKQKIKDFEKTLEKKTDAADEAVKEIDDSADDLAGSDYLKKILTKARIERSIKVAEAKIQSADGTEQSELKDRLKDNQERLKEADAELNTTEAKAEQTKKKLGLDDTDFKKLEGVNIALDNIKDKEEVLRKKGDDPEAKKNLSKLDQEKYKQWQVAAPILDKVKDKNKKGSMYRTLTGNQNISNSAELEDYMKVNGGVASNREKLEKAVEDAQVAYDAVKDGEDKAAEITARIKLITAKLAIAKDENNEEDVTTQTEALEAAKEEQKSATQVKDPVKDFLDSDEGKGFSTTKPSDEDLPKYDTKTIKGADGNDVVLYKLKAAGTGDPVKDFLDSDKGKGFSTTKPADDELEQYETTTVKDKDGNDVVLYKKKEPAPAADPVNDFLKSDEGKGFSTTKPSDEDLPKYDTKTVKDKDGNDVVLYKLKAAGDPAAKKKLDDAIAKTSEKLEKAKLALAEKQKDPEANAKAIEKIQANIDKYVADIEQLQKDRKALGESFSDYDKYFMELESIDSKIDELFYDIQNISKANHQIYESVAQRFRNALNSK